LTKTVSLYYYVYMSFEILPRDVQLLVFGLLDWEERLSFARTCKSNNTLFEVFKNQLFKRFAEKGYADPQFSLQDKDLVFFKRYISTVKPVKDLAENIILNSPLILEQQLDDGQIIRIMSASIDHAFVKDLVVSYLVLFLEQQSQCQISHDLSFRSLQWIQENPQCVFILSESVWKVFSATRLAACHGRLDIIDRFSSYPLESGEEFYLACQNGHLEVAKKLYTLNPGFIFFGDKLPLHGACENGHLEVVNFLLDCYLRDDEDEDGMSCIDRIFLDHMGPTPFELACRNGHRAIAMKIISIGVIVTEKELDAALWNGHWELFLELLPDANVENLQKYLNNLYLMAAWDQKFEIADRLLTLGINVPDLSMFSTSWSHYLKHNPKKLVTFLCYLLSKGFKWDKMNGEQKGAFFSAVTKVKDWSTARVLFDLEIRNSKGPIAQRDVSTACTIGYLDFVQKFLASCASFDRLSEAFCSACEEGHLEIVKLLVAKGASVEEVSSDWRGPLHIACEEGHLDIVKFLIEKGAKLETLCKRNWTPLHYACRGGKIDMVRYLLSIGANVNARNNRLGLGPIDQAIQNRYDDIVKLLENA